MQGTRGIARLRTWREDGLVLAMLAAILLTAAIFLHPANDAPAQIAEKSLDLIVAERPPTAAIPMPAPILPHPESYAPQGPTPLRGLAPQEEIGTAPAFITLFADGMVGPNWYLANRDSETGFWRNDFRKANVTSSADGLALTITDKNTPTARPWNGGEVTSTRAYGYGRYEAIMKPARGEGLISSFFTYTGPWVGTPHDEIDIEFLGKDTRRVEFNMFRNGKPAGSKAVDLPFDAADAFHLYAFEWHPDHITWYVDGKIKHRVLASEHNLPNTPSRIMMNIWTGKMPGWHGEATFTSGARAEYACVSFSPLGSTARRCADFHDFGAAVGHQYGPKTYPLNRVAIEP